MLLREAQTVHQGDLCEPLLGLLSKVDKPADPGIAFAIGCMWARDLDDGQVEPSGLFDMHVLPPADAHRMAFLIGSMPALVRMRLRARIRELQFSSIFAWLSGFASVRRRWLIKAAIALESAQQVDRQSATSAPQPVAIIASVKQNQQAG